MMKYLELDNDGVGSGPHKFEWMSSSLAWVWHDDLPSEVCAGFKHALKMV